MKKILLTLCCLALTTSLFAQDCSKCIFLQSGKVITETVTDMNNAPTFTIVGHVSTISNVGGATVSTVISEQFDIKGKSINKKKVLYKCSGGTFMQDVHTLEMQTGMADTRGPAFITYPAGIKVGDHFPDAVLPYQSVMGGVPIDWENLITGRQVVGRETVTTTAGTWTALKITYNITSRMKGAHPPHPEIDQVTEWYVPGVGVVQYTYIGMKVKITKILGS